RRRIAAIGFEPLWGIPYLAPEIVLLFKAKSTHPKDEMDFRNALPLLSIEARGWLREALTTAHEKHPWIAPLTRRGALAIIGCKREKGVVAHGDQRHRARDPHGQQ